MTSNRSWFAIKAADVDGNPVPAEIMLYDEIGGWGIGAKEFDTALKALGDVSEIVMRINSPGGSVFDGLAIYNTLTKHPAKITAYIDGIAASSASLIAMAADKIIAPENAFMVIHEPSALTIGPASAHAAMAADLERMSESFAKVYSDRSKQPVNLVRALMTEDRLMGAKEAKSLGYVDEMEEPKQMSATFSLDKLPLKHKAALAAFVQVSAQEVIDMTAVDEKAKLEAKVKAEAEAKAKLEADTKSKEATAAADAAKLEADAKAKLEADAKAKLEADVKAYGDAEKTETLELCALARAPASAALQFIANKTPIAEVRSKLMAAQASATDRAGIQIVDPSVVGADDSEKILARKREVQKHLKSELGIGR